MTQLYHVYFKNCGDVLLDGESAKEIREEMEQKGFTVLAVINVKCEEKVEEKVEQYV